MKVKIKRASRGRVAHLTLKPQPVYFLPQWASLPTAADFSLHACERWSKMAAQETSWLSAEDGNRTRALPIFEHLFL